MHDVNPVVVVFENISEKELTWAKIKENKKSSEVVVTQFSGSKLKNMKKTTGRYLVNKLKI